MADLMADLMGVLMAECQAEALRVPVDALLRAGNSLLRGQGNFLVATVEIGVD